MKTIIYTSYPCVIKIGDKQEELSQNENLLIEEEFDKISVYPAIKGRIAFEIDFNEKENSFYRIIKHGGKWLIFLIDGLHAENVETSEFNYQNIKSKIEIYPQKVVFSNSNNKKIIHLTENFSSFKYGNIKFIDYCILNNNDGENTLICYNAKKNTAKTFTSSDIKIENNEFILTSYPFGYASIIQHFYIDEEGLKVRKKDFVQASAINSPEQTLPYRFLNSIKIGDYKYCLKMLAPQLNDRLNEESLKAYFGNISYFYMLSPLSAYAISNDKNVIFEFAVKDNKIAEISCE